VHLEAETCEQIYIRQSSNISITKRVFEISYVTLKELERVLRRTFGRRERECQEYKNEYKKSFLLYI
jgi:hypothetical protein